MTSSRPGSGDDPDSRGEDTRVVPERYRVLPPPIRLADTIATIDPDPPPDPLGGRDPEWDFMLRHAGG